jgi:hypothetical protein
MVHYPHLLRDHRTSSDSLAVPNGVGSVNRSAQLRQAQRAPVSDDRQLRLALAPTEDRAPRAHRSDSGPALTSFAAPGGLV